MSTPLARLGAPTLALAGALFILYPAVRPWHDESTVDGAIASMSSGAWVASHLFAMIGFILVPLALLALRGALAGTRSERLALTAAITTWIGAGLTLPYYGAEDFGLHEIASSPDASKIDLLAMVDAVRLNPVAATTFMIGLLALGAGAIMAGMAVWRSGVLARYSAIPFAVGFALFIPQFWAPAAVRIAHGVLVGAGCAWLAWEIRKAALRKS
ncbi:hypothetical protein [Phytohabitans aurantiacus]|jgi:hypothetical protein|uniref:DUF4386 domain-containing protein n=1 Tax=Phytohabitans aurantiacus TaxID=3016789 RepID=A0ABQ5QLF3_9ACTN|nr:hypothetical protein [Phytohabitans aurantiacus]GLH95027.1 hypothetical protein Pa4123_02990 [Phytohabitans aurantiacus]